MTISRQYGVLVHCRVIILGAAAVSGTTFRPSCHRVGVTAGSGKIFPNRLREKPIFRHPAPIAIDRCSTADWYCSRLKRT
jgi:hypothetical protein